MSGSQTTSTSEPRIGTLKVQTSMYGLAIPLAWGTPQLVGNLVWFNNFMAIPHTSTTSQGGKGGGGVKQVDTKYEYRAAAIMGLCRGPINGIRTAWKGKQRLAGEVVAGQTLTLGHTATVPGSPYQVTVPGSANFLDDLGVFIPGTPGYSSREFDYEGGPDIALVRGLDYTVSAGVYTFSSTLATKSVSIAYRTQTAATWLSALNQLGLSLASGAVGQPVWAWLSSAYPSEALAYSGLAYVYDDSYQLTNQAEVENLKFEVVTGRQVSSTVLDADPSDVVADFLTNPYYGVGWRTGRLAPLTQFRNYVRARELWLSPSMLEQKPARDWLLGLAEITNAEWTWQGGQLDLVPRGDASISSTFGTYTPVTTPVFDLVHGEGGDLLGPVEISPVVNEDAFNIIRIEWTNRANGYAIEIMDAKDAAHIEQFGERPDKVVPMHAIHDAVVAQGVAQQLLQRQMTVWNTYAFRTPFSRALLGLMDLATLTDADSDLLRVPVRITGRSERGRMEYEWQAEDAPIGAASAPLYGAQAGAGYQQDYNAAPGSIATPMIFEAPGALTATGLELYVAAAGLSTNWGGCRVWMSLDGTTYLEAAVMYGPSRYGTLSASAGASGTISVTLLRGELNSGSTDDAAALNTLCYIAGASNEFFALQQATLTAPLSYDLGGTPVRGAYGTTATSHASGDKFVRVDNALGKSGPIDLAYVGKTVHLKFTSFNVYGLNEESLAGVTDYPYTITGQMVSVTPPSFSRLALGPEVALNAVSSHMFHVRRLNDTQAIALFIESLVAKAAVISVDAYGAITMGTPFTLPSGNFGNMTLEVLSPTKAVAAYPNAAASQLLAVVLTFSGTTVTAGSTASIITEACASPVALAVLSATKLLVAWNMQFSPEHAKFAVLDVSGTTITPGTVLNTSVYGHFARLLTLSSTTVLATFLDASSYPYSRVMTISGSTVTAGTAATLSGTALQADAHTLVPVTADLPRTRALLVCASGAATKGVMLEVASGLVSYGGYVDLDIGPISRTYAHAADILAAGKCLVFSAYTGGLDARLLVAGVSGTGITVGAVTVGSPKNGTEGRLVVLNAQLALLVYANATPYLAAERIQIS